MREIKFRAFDEQYGMLSGDEIESLHEEIATGLSYGALYVARKADYENDWREFKVMQFTGLLDKNGVEIYEGDIVEERWDNPLAGGVNVDRYTVSYATNSIYKMLHSSGEERWHRALFLRYKDIEVIGNVYENKELINND